MLFSAEIIDFRTIYNVLKAITFRENAILRPMEEGLKFTLEDMKSVETSAYIPKNMFSKYTVEKNEDVSFKISMKVFTECLNIFGDDGNSSIKMSYPTHGAPLTLVVYHNEDNITVDCDVQCLNLDDSLDISLSDECNMNKIVINADILVELLQRLDNAADEIDICLSPDPPYITMASTGRAGEAEVAISKYADSVTIFECKQKTISKYAYTHLRQILKVMGYADKVQISTAESGLLGFQLVINSSEKNMYIEYYVTSQFFDD